MQLCKYNPAAADNCWMGCGQSTCAARQYPLERQWLAAACSLYLAFNAKIELPTVCSSLKPECLLLLFVLLFGSAWASLLLASQNVLDSNQRETQFSHCSLFAGFAGQLGFGSGLAAILMAENLPRPLFVANLIGNFGCLLSTNLELIVCVCVFLYFWFHNPSDLLKPMTTTLSLSLVLILSHQIHKCLANAVAGHFVCLWVLVLSQKQIH